MSKYNINSVLRPIPVSQNHSNISNDIREKKIQKLEIYAGFVKSYVEGHNKGILDAISGNMRTYPIKTMPSDVEILTIQIHIEFMLTTGERVFDRVYFLKSMWFPGDSRQFHFGELRKQLNFWGVEMSANVEYVYQTVKKGYVLHGTIRDDRWNSTT